MTSRTDTGPTPADGARGRPLAHLVLDFIWRRRQVSRAEIARTLGISRSTVSDIVNGLMETGLVAEGAEGPSRGGRPPTLIVFQDDAHMILGVDMGATHVSVALTDLRGKVLSWQDREHPVRSDPVGTRALIRELCEAALNEVPESRERLMGIGIAVPSPIDPSEPERLHRGVMPAWEGRAGFDELRRVYEVPILVDNDANLGALAERWWGGAEELDDFAYIKLATGIGSGHMIRGEIYRGSSSVAGEIGHVTTDPSGEPCLCGNRGCLTTFAGAAALLARAEALKHEYPESRLATEPEVSLATLEEAALSDDPLALRVVREAAHHLGIAIAGLLNVMNPAAVFLGGSITRVGDRILFPIRETVLRRTLVDSVAASEIRITELGPRAFAIGASTLVLATALESPTLFPQMAGV